MTPDEYKTLLDVSDKLDNLIAFKAVHEHRIRRLEWFRTWAAGVGSAVTAFFTYLFASQH